MKRPGLTVTSPRKAASAPKQRKGPSLPAIIKCLNEQIEEEAAGFGVNGKIADRVSRHHVACLTAAIEILELFKKSGATAK